MKTKAKDSLIKKKRKPRPAAADEATTVDVRLYAQTLQKWDSKKQTRVLSAENGLLVFSHKRPRSAKRVTKTVPIERVLQYGGSADEGWVYLMSRQLVDSFTAQSVVRKGKTVTFDLGSGVTTTVNVDADYEIVSV